MTNVANRISSSNEVKQTNFLWQQMFAVCEKYKLLPEVDQIIMGNVLRPKRLKRTWNVHQYASVDMTLQIMQSRAGRKENTRIKKWQKCDFSICPIDDCLISHFCHLFVRFRLSDKSKFGIHDRWRKSPSIQWPNISWRSWHMTKYPQWASNHHTKQLGFASIITWPLPPFYHLPAYYWGTHRHTKATGFVAWP